jgi:hypothetical protein
MLPDTVQIGSLQISKTLFDVLVPLISGFLGTFVGGFITYFVTKASENRKWQKEKNDLFQEHKRKALAIVLEWIGLLQKALSDASFLSSRFQRGIIDHESFVRDFPYVISVLKENEPPASFRVMLPEDVYSLSREIVDGIEKLKYLVLENPKPDTDYFNLVATLEKNR